MQQIFTEHPLCTRQTGIPALGELYMPGMHWEQQKKGDPRKAVEAKARQGRGACPGKPAYCGVLQGNRKNAEKDFKMIITVREVRKCIVYIK